jgi:hypothetical protein
MFYAEGALSGNTDLHTSSLVIVWFSLFGAQLGERAEVIYQNSTTG